MVTFSACGPNNNEGNGSLDNKDNVIDNQEINESNNNDETNKNNEANKDNETAKSDESLDIGEKMAELGFAEFEVEIDYADDKEYEADIEKRANGDYKVEVEDELTNTFLKGQDAFDHLYPILQKLEINPDSTKEEVISTVLDAFGLEENYVEFEVDIVFSDGTKLEYEDE